MVYRTIVNIIFLLILVGYSYGQKTLIDYISQKPDIKIDSIITKSLLDSIHKNVVDKDVILIKSNGECNEIALIDLKRKKIFKFMFCGGENPDNNLCGVYVFDFCFNLKMHWKFYTEGNKFHYITEYIVTDSLKYIKSCVIEPYGGTKVSKDAIIKSETPFNHYTLLLSLQDFFILYDEINLLLQKVDLEKTNFLSLKKEYLYLCDW